MSKNQTFFIRLLVISILFFPLSIKSFSQSLTLKEIEKDLSDTYSKIFPFYYGNHDSLDFYSSLFSDKMHKYIGEYPSTLNYPFQSLIDSNDCTIVTSKDRLFRIYSWDTWLGGTMHFFENIYQYGSGNRAFSKTDSLEEGDPSGFYSDIFILEANNKTYYLAIEHGMYSTRDVGESIGVFTIENNRLNDTVKLIKTSSRFTNSISIGFDFFKAPDNGERPIRLIKYDIHKKIIYIPIVLEDGTVTSKFILYKFNGKYFERITPKKTTSKY